MRSPSIDEVTLAYLWEQRVAGGDPETAPEGDPLLFASGSRKAIRVKSAGQQQYVDAVRSHDVVFATSTPLTVGVPGLLASWVLRRPLVVAAQRLATGITGFTGAQPQPPQALLHPLPEPPPRPPSSQLNSLYTT